MELDTSFINFNGIKNSNRNNETESSFINNHRQNNKNFVLTWKDISVWVNKKQSSFFWSKSIQTTILQDVHGIAKSGELIAIMGASGSGKTTLLATISQRIKGNNSGTISLNGKRIDRDFIRKISGFVPQHDLAIDTLTVKEHINFMGHLKINKADEQEEWTRTLLTELGLIKCVNTRLSNLSGGERKRLSLAVQLLTNPPILFCDEPTTGLDSYSAISVIEKLRQLCILRGMSIICTIHQPASGLFELFNKLILLSNGRVAYQGDIYAAHRYFANKGLVCPATYNTADFYVSQLAIKPGKENECMIKVGKFCDDFENSSEGLQILEEINEYATMNLTSVFLRQQSAHFDIKKRAIVQTSWFKQLYWILWRQAIHEKRKYFDNLVKLIAFLFVGFIISVPFINLIVNDQKGIQNTKGVLYLIVIETIFTFIYSVFDTFPHEMPVLLREISDSLYKPAPYYLSKMLLFIPGCVFLPFLFTLIIFYIAGLNGGFYGFFTLFLVVVVCAIAATGYGAMLSTLFNSISTASLVSVPIEFVSLTFSGIFLKISTLPIYLSWIRYISIFYYGNEAANIIQWSLVPMIECSNIPGAPCLRSGHDVLNSYGFDESDIATDFLGLFAIYFITNLIGFLSILRRSKTQPIY